MVGPECVEMRLASGSCRASFNDPDTPRKIREATILIKSPEAVELHFGEQEDQRQQLAQQICATQRVLAYTEEQGCLNQLTEE